HLDGGQSHSPFLDDNGRGTSYPWFLHGVHRSATRCATSHIHVCGRQDKGRRARQSLPQIGGRERRSGDDAQGRSCTTDHQDELMHPHHVLAGRCLREFVRGSEVIRRTPCIYRKVT